MLDPARVRAILLDIEGTTTPITFVYDVLFPYAERNIEPYLRLHLHEKDIRTDIAGLRMQWAIDEKNGLAVPNWSDSSEQAEIESVTGYVKWLISRDSKLGELKSLQGKIWRDGYETGQLTGMLFDDVPAALHRWHGQGKKASIYSSGSVLAQRLLFGHSNHGDLTPLLDGFFDTSVGPKADPNSYRTIANVLQLSAAAVLFISDAAKELNAAESAGMQIVLSVRPGNPDVNSEGRTMIRSFDELPF